MKSKEETYTLDSIEQDANINRLLDTCALKETDHIPCFEHYVMKRSME